MSHETGCESRSTLDQTPRGYERTGGVRTTIMFRKETPGQGLPTVCEHARTIRDKRTVERKFAMHAIARLVELPSLGYSSQVAHTSGRLVVSIMFRILNQGNHTRKLRKELNIFSVQRGNPLTPPRTAPPSGCSSRSTTVLARDTVAVAID